MKKIIFAIIIILIGYQFLTNDSPKLARTLSLGEGQSVYSGNLILINKDIELHQDPENLAPIPADIAANVVVDSDSLLDANTIKPLQQMFEAAQEDGVQHFIINSTYRSGATQQQLFDENGPDYALPSGHSEHQTGLSLDIGSTQGTIDNTPEGEWLAKHAHEFGFILRYPENKTDITGIAFEPWHFRYVGLPHSAIIEKKDLAFEEYIKFIKKKKEYTYTFEGVDYFIQYTDSKKSVKIPDTEEYSLSGDNQKGFIVTSVID